LKYQVRSSGPRGRLSSALLGAQVTLSVVIVTVAGLLVHSFENLATLPLGFDRDRVLLVNVDLSRTQVASNDRVRFIEQLLRRVAAAPGVEGAAASMVPPAAGFGLIDAVRVPGVPFSPQVMIDGRLGPDRTFLNFVTPGWFRAHGTPIRAGRDFNERDWADAEPVIVVNESAVRTP
jgi:putative ABC transport system permease protein